MQVTRRPEFHHSYCRFSVCLCFFISFKHSNEVIAHNAEGDAEDFNRAAVVAHKAFDEVTCPKMTVTVTLHSMPSISTTY